MCTLFIKLRADHGAVLVRRGEIRKKADNFLTFSQLAGVVEVSAAAGRKKHRR